MSLSLRPSRLLRRLAAQGVLPALFIATMVAAACGRATSDSALRRPAAGGDSSEGGLEQTSGFGTCRVVNCEAGRDGAGGLHGSAGLLGEGAQAGASAGEGGEAAVGPSVSVSLSAISVTQTLELTLMRGGEEVEERDRKLPLIAGKRALLRAFVQTTPDHESRPLIGVLDLSGPSGTDTLVSERVISGSSVQDALETTFVFDIEARDLEVGTSYHLRVLEADTTPLLRFPATGSLELAAKQSAPLELVLVPMVANGFSPNTGDDYLSALQRRVLEMYPVSEVRVSLRKPVTLTHKMSTDVGSWDPALDAIYELRRQDAPNENAFYYGMLAPAATYDAYCAFGDCIVGYALIAEPDDVYYRGAIGVTVFADGSGTEDAGDTLAHELGHSLGRSHSFCDVPDDPDDPDDLDLEFPYPNGGIGGIYGFDFDGMALLKPNRLRDVMGYCVPVWISDYTYLGLFERLSYVAETRFRTLALAPTRSFRVARIGHYGSSTWQPAQRTARAGGRAFEVSLLGALGAEVSVIEARVFRLDHSPGSYVWLRADELSASGAFAVDLSPLGGSLLLL